MGTGAPAGAAIGTYTGFQNYGALIFTGTGDMRTSTPSTGYAGASGSNNVYFNGTGENFQIANINTSACSSFTLTFGLYKSTNAETGTNMVVEVSPDGVTYSPLSFAALPTGSGTVGWYLVTINTGIPSTANLRIRFRTLVANDFRVDDVKLIGTCGGGTSITTGFVNTPPFVLASCTATAIGNVEFTSTGTFNAGNIYTAQLSDAAGSFSSPVNVGTLTSSANSGTINVVIPATTASGTGYVIRVISDNPSTIGSNSAAFTITLTCTSSSTCSVGGAMGSNQTNFGCGSNAPCNLASVYSTYGTFCGNVDNTGCSSSCITAAVSATYSLPSGCTASITAEYKARTGMGACSNSAMDSGDQLYITNSGGTVSSQSASLTSCAGFTSTVSSSISNGCGNGDGVVKMNITGGIVTIGGVVDRGDEIVTYTINFSGTCGLNCPTLLPMALIDFYGIENGDYNDVVWKVAAEKNITHYIVEKSEDGIHFREFNIQSAKGNEQGSEINYYAQDADPVQGITYYRLSTLEGGSFWNIRNYKTISVDRYSDNWKSLFYQKNDFLYLEFEGFIPKNNLISLFDVSGQLLVEVAVDEYQTKINTQDFSPGIYFIRISTPYKIENIKLIIQK
ncbi:MAG: T9SS type A sorting domain-containing protein [Bacteroidota bacterium]